jgi:hypothetical protein
MSESAMLLLLLLSYWWETLHVEKIKTEQMDSILCCQTSDEEAMPQQTKRRGIAKKRNVGELLPMFSRRKKLMTISRRNNKRIAA